MTRDFLIATLTALGLAGCGPDLTTETAPPTRVGAAPAPAANDPAPAAGDPKEGEKKEDGEKQPR